MSVSLRPIFPGSNVSLKSFASKFGLPAPVSLRTLAAHQGIESYYQSLGGYKGRLGVITSPITRTASGQSFVRSHRGGDLTIEDATGQVTMDNGLMLRIVYQGIHCFGNPGGIANSDAYAFISLLGVEQQLLVLKKVPEDGTDDYYKNFEAGQESTQGQITILGFAADLPIPPQTLTIAAQVWHCGLTGGNSQGNKAALAQALGVVAAGYAVDSGYPAAASEAEKVGEAIGNALSNFFGLSDTCINTVTHTFKSVGELTALPPSDSLKWGNITYNFAFPPITNGDATYGMYFNIEVLPVGPPLHTP